jgi:DNA-binding NarL/FixJ family response regulator
MEVVVVGRDPHEAKARRAARRAGFDVGPAQGIAGLVQAAATPPGVVLVAAGPSAPAAPLVAKVRSVCPDTPVVVLGSEQANGDLLASVVAGADGYVPHGVDAAALGRVIHAVARGEIAISRSCTKTLVEALRLRQRIHGVRHRPLELTQREWEVALLLLQDRSTSEISKELFVSAATVRTHVASIVHKLGAADRAEALTMLRAS